MGLFGSSDDESDEETTPSGSEETAGIPDETAARQKRDRVSDLVADVDAGIGPTVAELVSRLDGPLEERIVAARALARVGLTDVAALEPHADRAIDSLARRDLARPIAEELLESAGDLSLQGLEDATIVEAALEALEVALGRFEDVRIDAESVYSGGGSEVVLADELRRHAETVDGREQLAFEATADAFEGVPTALARRAGLDPIDALVDLRSEHQFGNAKAIDTNGRELVDAETLALDADELEARLTDGVALGAVVFVTQGTVAQLDTLTGYAPYPG